MTDVPVAGSTWQVADVVNGQDGRSKEPCASRQQGSLRIVRLKGGDIPLRKDGNVFVIDLWVRKDATSRMLGFHRQA